MCSSDLVGLTLAGIASAAMDVSDGLVQDLGHICRASGLAAEIVADNVPLSDAARAAGPDWLTTCLTGGDDYEVLMAVPPGTGEALRASGIPVTRIGILRAGEPAVTVLRRDGSPMMLDKGGWSHF